MRYFLIVVGIVFLIVALITLQNLFASPLPPKEPEVVRYIPLGDSYTIGTKVDPQDSFPQQLVFDLNTNKIPTILVTNPAGNGWTSQQLIDNELPIFEKSAPTFTTLLIGVNDWNRGVPITTFKKNLKIILDRVQKTLPDPTKIILITIPDFSVTPTGETYGDPQYNSMEVQKFNAIVKDEAKARNLQIVDVFFLSQEMGRDPSLLASDKLHPSAKEYRLWEKEIFPVAKLMLKAK